jgi:hypothetical protein
MKWSPRVFGSLTAILIVGCGGGKRNNETGAAAGGAGAESGTMQGGATGTATDTGMRVTDTTRSGMSSDTAGAGSRMHTDTSSRARKTRSNQ